ncbi:MAG: hypothetical protein II961_04365 [Candidatus Riflebacteria bacterium]|nr:hypothetical protein [Candidatus Riflebacteria bacterium]
MNKINNLIPIIIFSFFTIIIVIVVIHGIPNELNTFIFETESCYDYQIFLKHAINEYQSKISIKEVLIETEADYKSLLKTLSSQNIIKYNVTKPKECFYRCKKNDDENIFCCIKHGHTDYAKYYDSYKTYYIIERIIDFIFALISILILKDKILGDIKKQSKSVKLTLILLLLTIPTFVCASRTSPAEMCQKNLEILSADIPDIFEMDKIELKPFMPGNSFKKLCEDHNINVEYYEKECSYGLTFIQDEPKFYCCHHGNIENIQKFERLHFSRVRPSSVKIPLGFYIFVVSFALAILMGITKKIGNTIK